MSKPLFHVPTEDEIVLWDHRHRHDKVEAPPDEFANPKHRAHVYLVVPLAAGMLPDPDHLGDEWCYFTESAAARCASKRGGSVWPLNGKGAHEKARRGWELRKAAGDPEAV